MRHVKHNPKRNPPKVEDQAPKLEDPNRLVKCPQCGCSMTARMVRCMQCGRRVVT